MDILRLGHRSAWDQAKVGLDASGLRISLPAEMIDEIKKDATENCGNKQIIHVRRENNYHRLKGDPYQEGLLTAFDHCYSEVKN